MEAWRWIVFGGVCASIICFLALGIVFALGKAAAPKTSRERIISDFMQLQSINGEDPIATELLREYIKRDTDGTLTSGCPVYPGFQEYKD